MKVVFSSAALADLKDIGSWIARDSPRRAKTYIRELREAALVIGRTPHSSPLREWMPGLRGRPHGNHTIFYTVEPSRVYVRRILHGGRDFGAVSDW